MISNNCRHHHRQHETYFTEFREFCSAAVQCCRSCDRKNICNNVIWMCSLPPSPVTIPTHVPLLLRTNARDKRLPSMCSKNIFLLYSFHSGFRTDFILKCVKRRTVFIPPSLILRAMLLAGANVRTYDCNVGSCRHYLRQVI